MTPCPISRPKKWRIVLDIPQDSRRDMYTRGDGCRMSKLQAFTFLKKLHLYWDDRTEQILENTNYPNITLTENAYYNFYMQGIDVTGSPGTEEQLVINMLMVSWPWIPKTLFNQLTELDKMGHRLIGWSFDRKIGFSIMSDGKAACTKGFKKYVNRKRSTCLEDGTIISY